MKFKVASAIIALYGLIGLGIVIFAGLDNTLTVFLCLILYVVIPAYGSYGAFVKSRRAIVISIVFFMSQSIRNVYHNSLLPHITPISLSFPFGDFANEQGYLVDCFAIFMVVFLAWLFKLELSTKSDKKQS